MKKTMIILMAIAFSFVSCNKEILDNTLDVNEASQTNIIFELTANHPDGAATKAVKTGWENDDVIYVFFNNVAAPKYLKMIYDGTQWTNTQMNGASEESLGLAENATGTMRAVYLPFGNALTVGSAGTAFTFSETTYSYYLTATLAYTVTDGKVSGAFDMAIPDGYVQFFLDDADASFSTEIELREPHLTPQGIASITADGTITHTTVASGAPLKGYVYDKAVKTGSDSKGYLFSGILAAEARNASTNYHFTLVSGGWQGSYFAKAFEGKTWYRGATEGRALKMPALSGWTAITDYKPIDLGFDVNGKRIYWASRNVGASSDFPTANTNDARHATWGDYYAWGETEPYYTANPYGTPTWADGKSSGYGWTSYSYATNNDNTKFSKYTASDDSYATSGTADGRTHLELVDDAVAQNVKVNGNSWIWRMPTYDEWNALLTNFDWAFDNTNKGRTVTVKSGTAWVSPTIFLPTAGRRSGTSLESAGSYGYYWSSSIYSPTNPWLVLSTDDVRMYKAYYRFHGFSVRPVSE